MTRDSRYAEARALQGHRAGFASRVVADAIDLGVAWLLGLAALLAAGVIGYLVTGPPFRLPVLPNWLDGSAVAAIAVGYLGLSWAAVAVALAHPGPAVRALPGRAAVGAGQPAQRLAAGSHPADRRGLRLGLPPRRRGPATGYSSVAMMPRSRSVLSGVQPAGSITVAQPSTNSRW